MKKIILSLGVISIALVSCNGEVSEEDKAKGKEVDQVLENSTNDDTDVIAEVENNMTVETVGNLPEGWVSSDIVATDYLYVPDSVTQEEMSSLADHYARGFGEVYGHILDKELQLAGAPMAIWKSWDTTAYSHLNIAMPVLKADTGNSVVKSGSMLAGPALKYSHFGDYSTMIEPHMVINEWAYEAKVSLGAPFEVYLTDPGMEPDTNKWETEIWYPILNK